MRFSEAWLREWVDPPIATDVLIGQLSMSGLEVDAVAPAAAEFTDVVVGHVMSVEPHPDAAKLSLCRVDAGADELLQIVCGAANVAAGMRVPVAVIGARLPGDFNIKKAKLRGIESFGMICSAAELGLAETSEGIMPLPDDSPVGEDLRAFMALDDQCIELDLTPDRGDCLSVAGVAREVGVLNRIPLRAPSVTPVAPVIEDRFPAQVAAPAACPRYLCRVLRGIDPGATTPLWMQERLRRSGLRTINAVVDVTNYVLMELGQPMHAFDLRQLAGGIEVRMARAGELLTLLNGDAVALRADTLVIADASRAVALAGIMGGAETAVGDESSDILLESAFFAPTAISGKARSYGLHTDSSHRFERGVDPQLQAVAMERATALLRDIVGGEPGPIVENVSDAHVPQREGLVLRRQRIPRVLGVELEDERITDILARLGMAIEDIDGGWCITAPSSRFDIGLEVDLIAELGRVYGYDNIEVDHARSVVTTRAPLEMAFDLARVRQVLVDRGFHEAITYSFISPEQQSLIEPDFRPLSLANPLSAELSVMRTSLWPGLLQAARQNLSRQQLRVRLFESGLRFRVQADGLQQHETLAGLIVGPIAPEQWGAASRNVDFHDLKADVEAVLTTSGCAQDCGYVAAVHPALHPGQCARIERQGQELGWIGTLHPSVAARWDLPADLQLFELRTDRLGDGGKPSFVPLSKFPSIRRDIAIVVDLGVSFQAVRDCLSDAVGDLLRDLVLFDVYVGERVDSGRKSMALGLILQADSHTLTDHEVQSVIARALDRLAVDLNATLRS
ncbi:MAG: phenylalanine--tRNA ligase subunit beta [Thiohalocapsa sp.]